MFEGLKVVAMERGLATSAIHTVAASQVLKVKKKKPQRVRSIDFSKVLSTGEKPSEELLIGCDLAR